MTVEVQQIKVLFTLPNWFTEGDEPDEIEEDMLMYSFKHGCEVIDHLCAQGIILDGGCAEDIPVLQKQLEQVLQVIQWRRDDAIELLRGEEYEQAE